MKGLPIISCTDPPCGACCMHMRSPPFNLQEMDEKGVPQQLRNQIREHVFGPAPDESPCLWLDLETRQCRHYDLRPDVCRDFERGSESCLMFRDEWNIGVGEIKQRSGTE